jgi:mannose-6-phosphate isomerase-like protein (cupin superfamily)
MGDGFSEANMTRVMVSCIAVFVLGILVGHRHVTAASANETAATPMILQENEGEQLIHRAGPLKGVPFTIKVDGQFGRSDDFFVFAETLAPGETIPFHRHENAEELLLFEESGASVSVGSAHGLAGSHSLVFIPRDTWISARNDSQRDVHALAIFSRHGFESYMRAISAKPGEPSVSLSPDELTKLRGDAHAVYWDYSKGPSPPGVRRP